MAEKAVSSVKKVLSKINLKAPWKMTGVASTSEYLEALPQVGAYRETAPGSSKVKAMIPHAETDRVYDIRYWLRDTRRQGFKIGGTNRKHMVAYSVNVHAKDDELAALKVPPRLGKSFKFTRQNSLLDDDNNGYT